MPCSFCNSPNHNITNCNNPLIPIYYDNIKSLYFTIISQNNSIEISENIFKAILNQRYYMKDLRAIGVKYLNVYARTRKTNLISILWLHLNDPVWRQQVQQIQMNNLISAGNSTLNITPENLQTILESDDFAEDASIMSYINNLYTSLNNMHFPVNVGLSQNLGFHFDAENYTDSEQIKKYKIPLILVEENKNFEDFEDCSICYDKTCRANLVKLTCNHEFCGYCIKNTLSHHDKLYNPSCALCRQTMLCFTVKNIETYNLIAEHCL